MLRQLNAESFSLKRIFYIKFFSFSGGFLMHSRTTNIIQPLSVFIKGDSIKPSPLTLTYFDHLDKTNWH